MPHFKAFSTSQPGQGKNGNSQASLELPDVVSQINAWMEEEQPHILFYAQGTHGMSVIFSFVYEHADDMAGAMTATASAEVPEAFEHSLESIDLDPTDTEITLLPEAELPY